MNLVGNDKSPNGSEMHHHLVFHFSCRVISSSYTYQHEQPRTDQT